MTKSVELRSRTEEMLWETWRQLQPDEAGDGEVLARALMSVLHAEVRWRIVKVALGLHGARIQAELATLEEALREAGVEVRWNAERKRPEMRIHGSGWVDMDNPDGQANGLPWELAEAKKRARRWSLIAGAAVGLLVSGVILRYLF